MPCQNSYLHDKLYKGTCSGNSWGCNGGKPNLVSGTSVNDIIGDWKSRAESRTTTQSGGKTVRFCCTCGIKRTRVKWLKVY